MNIQALTIDPSIDDINSWAIKKVRGRLMIKPKPEEIISPEEEAFANSVYLQVELKYIWVADGANKECQIAMSWAPYYYPLDSTTPREYNFSDTKFHKVFKDINGGFTIENIATDNASIINLNSHTIERVNPQYFKLVDTEWKSDPTFSFIYNTEEDGITYSISIPKWTIPRPSKYDNNLVFNKDGLEDFINQIHEYPKTVFGIETLNSTETEKDNIGFGNVPVQIHGKWYGVPVQGLTGSGSGSGGNISSVDMIASYATYDASEVNNDPKIAISDKYVKKAGDTMTGLLRMGQPDDHGYSIIVQDQQENPARSFSLNFSTSVPTRYGLYDDTNKRWILYSDNTQENGQPINPPIFNGKANELTIARQLAVDLSNTSTETTFNGSANVTNIKVSGTLPIANGGTGFNGSTIASVNDIPGATAAYMNLQQYLTHIHGGQGYYNPSDDDCLIGLRGKARDTVSYSDTNGTLHTVAEINDNLIFDLGAYGMQLFDTTKQTALWAIDFKDNIGKNTSHTYVQRSGDTMTDQLTISELNGSSWYNGRDSAFIRRTESNGAYLPIWSCKSLNGEWTCGTYKSRDQGDNNLYWTYIPDDHYEIHDNDSSSQMRINDQGHLTAVRVYNAVFNDYAECRTTIDLTPGHVVVDQDDGSLACSTTRLQPGAQVISDTYGHCMGETETAKTPLAVAGRVLVYTYQPRENYHAGMAVCSAPNGTVDIMTREEIRDYPDCIIGIVSEIPQYKTWGSDNVEVNGRIWIKVK